MRQGSDLAPMLARSAPSPRRSLDASSQSRNSHYKVAKESRVSAQTAPGGVGPLRTRPAPSRSASAAGRRSRSARAAARFRARAARRRAGSSPMARSQRPAGARGRSCRGSGGCARSRRWAGIRRSSSCWRSRTPPGSCSIVVTATVEPVAKTVMIPRSTPDVATTRATPSVMSTMSPFPCVSRRSIPPWTAIRSPPRSNHLDPREPPLAELQDFAVENRWIHVERAVGHLHPVEPDAALGQASPRLGG